MRKTKRFRGAKSALLGVLCVIALSTSAWAVPIDLSGVNYPNLSAHAEFTYQGLNNNSGYVYISISNTSAVPDSEDPRLTSFAFNVPTGVSFANSMQPTGWEVISSPNGINTPGQYGSFDIAGATGPNFNGGSPNFGIPVGGDLGYTIYFSGSGMLSLTEESFLSLFSNPGPGQPDPQYFIARFQQVGPGGGGSDVAIPGGGNASVPEPATLLLLGTGLVGIAGLRRRYSR